MQDGAGYRLTEFECIFSGKLWIKNKKKTEEIDDKQLDEQQFTINLRSLIRNTRISIDLNKLIWNRWETGFRWV